MLVVTMADCCRNITCRGKHFSLPEPSPPMMTRRCLGLKGTCLGDLAKTWQLDWNSIVIMKTHPDLSHSNFDNSNKHSTFRILCFFYRLDLEFGKVRILNF